MRFGIKFIKPFQLRWDILKIARVGAWFLIIAFLAVLASAAAVYYFYTYRSVNVPIRQEGLMPKSLSLSALDDLMKLLKKREGTFTASTTITTPPAFQ
ncbi:MAG: hypothetical protein HYT40_03540 [Candidatus Sungbacteria bacterium]|uniref:Uncharacterized protein n=1 Tax=Candidatus Sungiibacteriota bacterium TaxID=2750080 RepID=A0A931SDP8_9BACT|nr:hypothetical protein [Candidatus Sungbacteria bacterium]